MKEIVTYLTFNGTCGAAMAFYQSVLGGELFTMPYKNMPNCPAGAEDRVLHSKLTLPGGSLMASDAMPGKAITVGDNFSISLDLADQAEQDRLFRGLAEGGTITMEPQDTFWGARFGMLTDKFGIGWMFNYDKGTPNA